MLTEKMYVSAQLTQSVAANDRSQSPDLPTPPLVDSGRAIWVAPQQPGLSARATLEDVTHGVWSTVASVVVGGSKQTVPAALVGVKTTTSRSRACRGTRQKSRPAWEALTLVQVGAGGAADGKWLASAPEASARTPSKTADRYRGLTVPPLTLRWGGGATAVGDVARGSRPLLDFDDPLVLDPGALGDVADKVDGCCLEE